VDSGEWNRQGGMGVVTSGCKDEKAFSNLAKQNVAGRIKTTLVRGRNSVGEAFKHASEQTRNLRDGMARVRGGVGQENRILFLD